jgi:hypothetical protein
MSREQPSTGRQKPFLMRAVLISPIMKITITPSEDQTSQKHPHDDVDCHIAIELAVNALIAWGFQRDTIIAAMEKYEP